MEEGRYGVGGGIYEGGEGNRGGREEVTVVVDTEAWPMVAYFLEKNNDKLLPDSLTNLFY